MNDVDRNRPLTTADLAGAPREKREAAATVREGIIEPAQSEEITRVPVRSEPEEESARSSSESDAPPRSPGDTSEKHGPLLASEESKSLHDEWDAIQIGFVDEPRSAVEKADQLVARAIQRLAEVFSDERSALEKQWARGDQVSTENLRLALQRYRSFFGRVLSV